MDITNFKLHSKKTLIALAMAGIVSCGGKTSQEYLSDAEQYYRDRDIQAAVIELKNALKQQQDFAEARALLGVIYTETGRPADAEKELKRAIDYGTPFEDVADALADVMLLQGKAKEVIKDFAITPDDSEYLLAVKSIALGKSHMRINDLQAAERFFDAGVNHDAVRGKAIIGQSLVALANRDLETAEQLVEKAIDTSPDNAKAWMTKANIMMAAGRNDEAEASFQKVITLSTNKASTYYQNGMRQLMRLQLARNDLSSAQKIVDTLVKANGGNLPSDPFLTYLRSNLAYQGKEYENASELANQVLMVDNNNLGAKLIIGMSDARLGKFVQAETHLQNFVAQSPQHDQARKTLALVQTQTKNPERALETLAPFKAKLEELDHETLALMAQTSYLAGKPEQSSEYLKQALKKSPGSASADLNYALAQSLTSQSEYTEALDTLSTLEGTSQQKQQALFTQAQIHIRANKFDEALKILEILHKDLPNNAAPAVLAGGIYYTDGNLEQAETYFQEAFTRNPMYLPAIRSIALLKIKGNDIAGAEIVYQSILDRDDLNAGFRSQLLIDLSELYIQQKKTEDAEKQLLKAKENPQAELQSSILLARLYLSRNKPQLAKNQLLEHKDKNIAAVHVELGKAQLLSKEFNGALDSYRKLSLLQPGSPVPNYQIASVQLQLGDIKSAKKSLQQALAINPTYMPAIQAMVNISTEQMDIGDALETLKALQKSAPDSPSTAYLEAELASAEKNHEKAWPIYQTLYQKTPNDILRQKLVQALRSAGKEQQAFTFLEEDVIKHNNSAQAHLLLANLHMAKDNKNRAIEYYERVISLDGKQVIALNNLAWLLKDEKPEEAHKHASLAHQLLPDNEEIKDTLTQVNAILKRQ